MKKLILNEILICSRNEQAAKKVKFHPRRTLIHGTNDTGKSSLIKSIFLTFGATPAKVNSKWKIAKAMSLVKFSVDTEDYSILRDDKLFAIFDGEDRLLKTFTSVTSQLGPYLAELLDFKVKLPDQQGKVITPPPAFIFLPFYVDQDSGWSTNYNSFGGLQQFKKPVESILLYHTGIRPNEYYETKSEINQLIDKITKVDEEIKITKDIINNIKEKLSSVEFNFNVDEFKDEIKELLVESEKLKKIEERHKNVVVDLFNKKILLETQIEIANGTLIEAEKDYRYAINSLEHHVECPTCGAEYENSFAERFEIAQDTDRCKELMYELSAELIVTIGSIDKNNSLLNKTMVEIEKIEALLQKKKGDLQLQDVIENAGRNELQKVFKEKMLELTNLKIDNSEEKERLEGILKGIGNKEKRDQIYLQYAVRMKSNLKTLEVTSLIDSDYQPLTKKINDTGSSLPRALTSYYFSIFNIVKKFSTSVYCPLVIDSPNQQAQDLQHIDKILEFINKNQPEDTQLILGLEELYNVDFECPIIKLEEKNHLLQKDDFNEVNDELKIFTNQIYSHRLFN